MKIIINEENTIKFSKENLISDEIPKIIFYTGKNIKKKNLNSNDIIINLNKKIQKKINFKNNYFVISITSCLNIKELKQMIKFLYKIIYEYKIIIGKSLENKKILAILDYENSNSFYDKELLDVFNAIFIENVKERYEFIYDTICKKLDEEFIKKNICDFKNDKCIANRLGKSTHSTMGCCYSFRYSKSPFELITDVKLCEHLKEKKCDTSCLTCKLFTCKYLRKNGIKFNINSFLLSAFFSQKQKDVLTSNFFRKKEEIIQKLLDVKNDKQFYFIYYANDSCRIR